LPSRSRALADDLGTQWTGNHIANPFKMRHEKPP
jgi:hypothetical protein